MTLSIAKLNTELNKIKNNINLCPMDISQTTQTQQKIRNHNKPDSELVGHTHLANAQLLDVRL